MRPGTCTHMTGCDCRGSSSAAFIPSLNVSLACRRKHALQAVVRRDSQGSFGDSEGASSQNLCSGEARFLTGTALRPFRETRYSILMYPLLLHPWSYYRFLASAGMAVLHLMSFFSLYSCLSGVQTDRYCVPTQTSDASSPLIPDYQDGRGPPVSQSWSCTPEAAAGAALHSSISQRAVHRRYSATCGIHAERQVLPAGAGTSDRMQSSCCKSGLQQEKIAI